MKMNFNDEFVKMQKEFEDTFKAARPSKIDVGISYLFNTAVVVLIIVVTYILLKNYG